MDVSADKVDDEIAVVRAQIAALRHRRSLLSATLLSSRTIPRRFAIAKTTTPSTASLPIADALSTVEDQLLAVLACNARTTCGITALRVQDPDPNAVGGGNVFGIRIDVFSTAKKQFLLPYHVFFQQLNGTSNLKLHKHTIPTFIPLSSLLRRYMATPNPESEDGDESPPRQDLPLFVRALRRELVSHAKRLDAVERLKAASVGKGSRSNRITAVTTSDPSAREVELDWADGDVAKLRIGIDGTVEKAVVRSKDGTASGRRKRRLERSILGEEGHVNGLPMRLRNANM